MYKKDLHRIEDSIFPFILEGLLAGEINADPDKKGAYEKAIKILRCRYLKDINTNKLLRRAERIEKKVRRYWENEKTRTLKAYMALSHLYKELKNKEQFQIYKDIDDIFTEFDDIFETECSKNESIRKQDKSAAKQAPKIFTILQGEGLF